MDLKQAKELLEKENEKKIKKNKRMQEYRDSDDFREKNAMYMRKYRENKKKQLEEAKKLIEKEKEGKK
jgi:hypothetical protein|tara:strand:- start:3662 stop:3865 length:204 start_codon:yes stop_codon:yes gene_type:complete